MQEVGFLDDILFPVDIWNVIFLFLDDTLEGASAVARLAKTSKAMRKLVNSSEEFWQRCWDKSGFVLKTVTFEPKTSMQIKFGVAAQAMLNLHKQKNYPLKPLHNSTNSYVRLVPTNNSSFLCINQYESVGYGSYGTDSPLNTKFVDLSKWPQVESMVTLNGDGERSMSWVPVGPHLAIDPDAIYSQCLKVFDIKALFEHRGEEANIDWVEIEHVDFDGPRSRRVITNRDGDYPYVLITVDMGEETHHLLYNVEAQRFVTSVPLALPAMHRRVTFCGSWLLFEDYGLNQQYLSVFKVCFEDLEPNGCFAKLQFKGKVDFEMQTVDILSGAHSKFVIVVDPGDLVQDARDLGPKGSKKQKELLVVDLAELNSDNFAQKLNEARKTSYKIPSCRQHNIYSAYSFANLIFLSSTSEVIIFDVYTKSIAAILDRHHGGYNGVSIVDSTLFVYHSDRASTAVDLLPRQLDHTPMEQEFTLFKISNDADRKITQEKHNLHQMELAIGRAFTSIFGASPPHVVLHQLQSEEGTRTCLAVIERDHCSTPSATMAPHDFFSSLLGSASGSSEFFFINEEAFMVKLESESQLHRVSHMRNRFGGFGGQNRAIANNKDAEKLNDLHLAIVIKFRYILDSDGSIVRSEPLPMTEAELKAHLPRLDIH